MSVLGTLIGGIASKVGAELIGKVLGGRFGPAGEALADSVVGTVAKKLGVEPAALPTVEDYKLEEAVLATERAMPEMLELWSQGLDHQFGLLTLETKEGALQSAWRWGWMYLLGFFWAFAILVVPVVEAMTATRIETVDAAILMTLTSWFLALYMGGHTVKELGKSAIEAVRVSKERR